MPDEPATTIPAELLHVADWILLNSTHDPFGRRCRRCQDPGTAQTMPPQPVMPSRASAIRLPGGKVDLLMRWRIERGGSRYFRMARMLEDLLNESRVRGWAACQGTLDQVKLDAAMLGWAEVPIRRGGPAVATLRPVDPAEAAPNSLSARYGKGAQPLHTDGAHLPLPPDIVILTSAAPSTTPTCLWSRKRYSGFIGGLPDFVQHGVFLVSSGNDSFFTTAVEGGRLRYDPGCMMPCDARSRQAVQFFQEKEGSVVEHQWDKPNQVLLIDNRRVLHARGSAIHEPQREIQRISFYLNHEAS
ncbi:TauD/TfdA family dioxygenase [Streptomyces rapamycinicus]|uniref:TauD/TfdA family dioxygenase n=1 Tax=Streptomyces rhizosphaericus TaxID=114699 RepID=A0A6G4ASN6_9ACTN|nr:TauD/TfdA family dioxygenase [Streptomyces rhizosphaericus]